MKETQKLVIDDFININNLDYYYTIWETTNQLIKM